MQVEMTPLGTPWIGLDSNPGGDRGNLTHVLQPCDSAGTAVTSRSATSWSGIVTLPFELIGKGVEKDDGTRHYRSV